MLAAIPLLSSSQEPGQYILKGPLSVKQSDSLVPCHGGDRTVETRAWGPVTQNQVLAPRLRILRGFRMKSVSILGGGENAFISQQLNI